MKKKYFTEEEKKEANRKKSKRYNQKHKEERAEYCKQYYQEHKEEISEYKKQWYQENKEERSEYDKQHRQTPMGRANNILQAYKLNDKKHNRGECTLTAQWIVDNIFTQKCHWCPETDWREMGCDRIDNALPHTPDNVIPCCKACNNKRRTKSYDEYKNALRAKETTL